MRPVADSVPRELLLRFAQNVADSIKAKDVDQSQLVAGILCHSASQHPDLAKILLETLDFTKIFDASHMDELTLLRLLNATTNVDIARHFNAEWFLDIIFAITKDYTVDRETQVAAKRLISRIRDWDILRDSLTNTQGDFIGAASLLRDIATDEQSFGILLVSLVMHEDIVSSLSENPLLPIPLRNPPLLLGMSKSAIPHDEFVAFLRAFIGVSCVLAVYAWADALPHLRCRERALGILRLWQGVDGYREIVNHLLLLRQMIYRLECMMDTDDPTRAGVEAEHILVNLSNDPRVFLDINFVDCIFELKQPLCFITEDERISLRQAAFIFDDGLPGAIKELLDPVELPTSRTSLRTLRVALAVIRKELDEQGEWQVLQDFRDKGSTSMVACLVEVFLQIVEEIADHFGLTPPSTKSHDLMAQLFRTADELLRLLLRLIPIYSLPTRLNRELSASVADLFVCTDTADMVYSQSSPPCVAAQETRQSCIDIIRMLSNPAAPMEGGKLSAEVTLKTLLQHALRHGDRDPAHHLFQVFCLIDHILPLLDVDEDQQVVWTQRVMPMLLQDLWAFCRALDTENKIHFVRRLVNLDHGVVGIGEWLLLEELKELVRSVRSLEDPSLHLNERAIRQYQVSLSLHFLADLAEGPSNASQWCVQCLVELPEAVQALASSASSLLDQCMLSPHLTRLARTLASGSSIDNSDLRFALVAILLRSAHHSPTEAGSLDTLLHLSLTILSSTIPETLFADRIRLDIGALFSKCGDASMPLDGKAAELLVSLMEWLITASESDMSSLTVLRGLAVSSYNAFCARLRDIIPTECIARLDNVQSKLTIEEDSSLPIPSAPLPESLILTVHEVEDLLRSNIPPPSTPPRNALNQDVLGLVTISPPAMFRSPASTGLTKTYSNNDFRQLRQTPSARQNTSRLPSMHVDDFESASPTLVSVPMPFESFQPLAPPFNPI
ncbi:hypothetical protein B0H21DRAFT_710305 [Amylocystis lapponica]|nr:hypothetical protein B0H21DRAFT_710305 [Amylocystis lapponica]